MSRLSIDPGFPDASSRGSLVDQTHEEILRLITNGELSDGDRIVIDRIARSYGTSLIPVREALARLQAEGLVTYERNKGYQVAARPTPEELERLFEARLVIELGAAKLAAGRAHPEAIARLKSINRRIARSSYGTNFEGFRDFITLNERFHIELVALADNPPLADAYRRLGYHQKIARPTYGRGPGDVKRFVREHDAIVNALEHGDHDALHRAVSAHIASGLERFDLAPSTTAGG
ncbi:GntR family transcriptional regulator [Bauldia litoralis]|uniref:GntR family transcriptional regulator n=2 Tax=Alphaproteobacteria TaxID=28211 RepID=UPI003265C80B